MAPWPAREKSEPAALTGAVAARSRVEAGTGIDEAAARFIQLAGRAAESPELGMAGAHGVLLAEGERFAIGKQGGGEDRESEKRI